MSRASLESLLGGLHPRTGEQLADLRSRAATRNRGYDAVFSAPKSVSLLSVVGGKAVAAALRSAHDRSVDAAFEYLDGQASAVRRYAGKTSTYRESSGFTGAAFSHATSRALDPHLHTHVVFANVGRGDDGKWSAYNSAFVWASARTAGFVYDAHLRHEVTRTLGLGWRGVANGVAELDGVDPRALRAFSTRARQIEDHLRGRGVDPSAASHRQRGIAASETRSPKPDHVDIERLVGRWKERLASYGIDEASTMSLLGTARVPAVDERADRLLQARVARAVESGRSPRSALRHAVRSACETIPAGADPSRIEDLARAALESPVAVVRRSMLDLAPVQCRGAEVRGADGRRLQTQPVPRRATEPELSLGL